MKNRPFFLLSASLRCGEALTHCGRGRYVLAGTLKGHDVVKVYEGKIPSDGGENDVHCVINRARCAA